MRQRGYRTRGFLLVSALGWSVSACGDKPSVEHLPPPPMALQADQVDPRPALPAGAESSEAIYEAWVSDVMDWGERRDLQARRWCEWVNTWLADKVAC
ncbi:hypothetical protein C7451_106164 [Blastomonas natatoria]|uniref:Uncharacterized protein n=2 Tax=Blastomonas natatoria TaxID=34015 RepID=A0A2V3V3D0_9SPHN|nr:hypothetical protein C7451_106164 [Blastomonas natatoria]